MFGKKNNNLVLVLDIGTEAIKGVLISSPKSTKKKEEKKKVISGSLEYFDKYRAFESGEPKKEIIKKALSQVLKDLGFEDLKKRDNLFLLYSFSPDILKARMVSVNLKREKGKTIKKAEEKKIIEEVLRESKKRASQIVNEELGILPKDLSFLDSEILKIKIEGYEVPYLKGYQGKEFNFRVLNVFCLKNFLQEYEEIIKEFGFKKRKILSPIKGLIYFSKIKEREGIFVDLGGEISQIYSLKKGNLQATKEVKFGGSFFSHLLSETLGLTFLDARALKERYAKGELSPDSTARIKEIFSQGSALKVFSENLSPSKILFSKDIFLFGGGALLPDIKEYLNKEKKGSKINLFWALQFLETFLDNSKILKNPQYTNSFLIYLGFLKGKF